MPEGELGLLIRMARGEKVSVEQVARASLTPSSVSVSPDISGTSQSTVAKVEANGDVSPFSLFGFGDSSKTTATGATSGVNGEQEAASRKSVKSQEMPGPFLKS